MMRPPVNIPVDSIYELQRSLHGVELSAYLSAEPVSEKRPSRLTDVAFHCVRPWLAAIDPKGSGLVWNYETRETVVEFSLGISPDVAALQGDAGDGDEEFGATAATTTTTTTPTAAAAAKGLLQKAASPTASYVRSLRNKVSSFLMLFYDHESVCWTTRSGGAGEPRSFFDEWLLVLTTTHVVVCDLNQPTAVRSVSSEDLQRQVPCSVEILPSGLLAIGCQDGKIRLWHPRLWRVVDTIDTGSTREVQQLLLLPLTVRTEPQEIVHFLTSLTLDGRVVTWKVSLSGECVKVAGVVELRDLHRVYDASSGLNEFRWHPHQDAVSGTSKDGTTYFFDLSPLTRQSKQMTLMSILPTTKLPGASVLSGPRKGAFVVVSLAASGSSVLITELVNKGRATTKDNVPANYLEFGVATSQESRDLRVPVGHTAMKKCKALSLLVNSRSHDELCCVTNFGVFILRATCLATAKPILITRGADKSPLVLYPGPSRVTLRFYGEETSSKQEDYKLQGGAADVPNERLRTPVLRSCPANPAFLSVLLPASAHLEVVQMDHELRNQKSINMHAVFSGNAIALAWHATLPRFAVLVPHEPNARRLTRSVSNVNNTPRRRGFMFGGSAKGGAVDEATAAAEARQKNSAARAMVLTMYEVAADGRVQSVADNCSCGDDRLLHIFSGPVLGVVKFEADADGGTSSLPGISASFIGANELHDSPSARSKRHESAVFSPTNGGGSHSSLSLSENDTGDLKKTTLEFFDWDIRAGSATLKRVGSGPPIDAPLKLEWERVTHRFCALVYPKSIKIYRVTTTPANEAVCLHDIPTSQTATSLYWMHHTLFFVTDEQLTCCVVSKTRVFGFDIASRMGFMQTGAMVSDTTIAQFPVAQNLSLDATTILGICNRQLVVAAPVQSLHTMELSNRVLQCCLLVSIGHADLALQVAETLSVELVDWFASVFEGFGFVSHAMRLTKLSLNCQMNMAIKHALLDDLERIVLSPAIVCRLPPSADATGASLLQRACICLSRGGRKKVVETVCRSLTAAKRSNDAIFLASLLNSDELFAAALEAHAAWGGAMNAAKRAATTGSGKAASSPQEILTKWNAQLSSATAPWKTVLERHAIRAPESISLTSQ